MASVEALAVSIDPSGAIHCVGRTLSVPNEATVTKPSPFPWAAVLAPVAASGVMFAITQLAMMLAFAALGPIIALGTVADQRMRRMRERRSENARIVLETAALLEDSQQLHDEVRTFLDDEYPLPSSWVRAPIRPEADRALRVGSRDAPLRVELSRSSGLTDARIGESVAQARVLRAAPAVVPSAADIVVVARQRPLALGFARTWMGEQLRTATEFPLTLTIDGGDAATLKHEIAPLLLSRLVTLDDALGTGTRAENLAATTDHDADADSDRVAVANNLLAGATVTLRSQNGSRTLVLCERAPNSVAVSHAIIDIRSVTHATLRLPVHGAAVLDCTPYFATRSELGQLVKFLESVHAQGDFELPDSIGLGHLIELQESRSRALAESMFGGLSPRPLAGTEAENQTGSGTSLDALIGVGARGPVSIDLVRDGPHAVVGGTTGSGKSEFLVTWLTSLAMRYSSSQVQFLFIDFKGGAAFEPLRALPHALELLTDLDPRMAVRVLTSLGAELEARERLLNAHKVSSLSEFDTKLAPPRLVIVADEFQALLDAFPQFQGLFADIAARGRSLGIHVVLCTQRPASAVGDALLANCSLRVALRLATAADSRALIGSDAAHNIAARTPGRAAVAIDGFVHMVQTARTEREVLGSTVQLRRSSDRPAPVPWLPPLPAQITARSIDRSVAGADRMVLGLIDRPSKREQVAFSVARDSSVLLVLGGTRSGKSNATRAVIGARDTHPAIIVSSNAQEAWDVLERLERRPCDQGATLVLDSFDITTQSLPEEYRVGFVERAAQIVRGVVAGSGAVVITLTKSGGITAPLAQLATDTVVLAMSNRNDHVFAGGTPANWVENRAAGSGIHAGEEVQFFWLDSASMARFASRIAADLSIPPYTLEYLTARYGALVVVSKYASRRRRELRGRFADIDIETPLRIADSDLPEHLGGPISRIIVGDPDAWQQVWGTLAVWNGRVPVVFDGCTTSDVRSLARVAGQVPPLSSGPESGLVLWDGAFRRITLGDWSRGGSQ